MHRKHAIVEGLHFMAFCLRLSLYISLLHRIRSCAWPQSLQFRSCQHQPHRRAHLRAPAGAKRQNEMKLPRCLAKLRI